MRLIDGDKLEAQFKNLAESWRGSFSGVAYQHALERIQDAQTVDVAALRPRHQAEKNEALTLDELRQMDGQPVYCPAEESWGIVKVDKAGQWKNQPFLVGHWRGVNFEWDIKRRGLKLYRRKMDKEVDTNGTSKN